MISDYLCCLRQWKEQYAPQEPDGEWNPLFCEALEKKILSVIVTWVVTWVLTWVVTWVFSCGPTFSMATGANGTIVRNTSSSINSGVPPE